MSRDWIYAGEVTGKPGLNWYTRVRRVLGADLAVGDCLDSMDHSGCRPIHRITDGQSGLTRRVWFSDCEGDTDLVRTDVTYDVVDPTSHVGPDGIPVGIAKPSPDPL